MLTSLEAGKNTVATKEENSLVTRPVDHRRVSRRNCWATQLLSQNIKVGQKLFFFETGSRGSCFQHTTRTWNKKFRSKFIQSPRVVTIGNSVTWVLRNDHADFSGHSDNHLEYFFSSIKNTHLSTVCLGQPVGGIAWHPRKSYLAVGHDQTVSVHHIPNKMLIWSKKCSQPVSMH